MKQQLKEYLYQEVDDWARISLGHFIGGSAMLALAVVIYLAVNGLSRLPQRSLIDGVLTIVAIVVLLAIVAWVFRYAYDLITGKR